LANEVRLVVDSDISADALRSEIVSNLEFGSQTETVVVNAAILRREASTPSG